MRMQNKRNRHSKKGSRRSSSFNTQSSLHNTLQAADIVLVAPPVLESRNLDTFNTFFFKENYSIYKINTLLQEEGRALVLTQSLNAQDTNLSNQVYVQVGSRQYYIYYNFDDIKSKFPPDQNEDLKSEHIEYILQYCINNIGIFIPYIIEEARYNIDINKKDIKDEQDNQNKDSSKKIIEEELLAESLHLFNQISEMPSYIVFDYFLGNIELLNKIISIILYELTKNKKNNTYQTKNTFAKIVDYFSKFNEIVTNLPIIQNTIDETINQLGKFDDLYKKSKLIIYNLVYKIIKLNLEKPLFSLSHILERNYFIKITKDAYRDAKAIQKNTVRDTVTGQEQHTLEMMKNKKIFQNIKNFFLAD